MRDLEHLQKQTSILLNLYNSKRFEDVIQKGKILLKKYPDQIILYNAISLSLSSINKDDEALDILKQALTLQPQNIRDFIYDKYNKSYLTSETSIDKITWYDSILFLQDINSLYIVFREKWRKNNNGTKKIFIKSKKLKRGKTRKKRLKDTRS